MPDPTPKLGFTFPGPVPKEALSFFRAKKFKIGFDYRDVWGAEHANAFTVAKAMRMDILEVINNATDQAILEGRTFAQFKKDLQPTLEKLGWWGKTEMTDPLTGKLRNVQLGSPRRLRTIYDANMRTARAAGQWERITRNKKTHPYLLYYLGPSEVHREEHVSWSGLMLPVDDPFWQTHYPPNGWGCKCGIRQVSKREYSRLVAKDKYQTKAPVIKKRKWTNKRTGEVLKIPKGIDPGWDNNPGMNRKKIVGQQLKQKTKSYKKTMAKPMPKEISKLWPENINAVFSTVKGVDRAGIERVISQIPGAAPQVEKLAKFLNNYQTQTLVLKVSEMGGGKATREIMDDVGSFLGSKWKASPRQAFVSASPSKTNGFTAESYNHVVIKAKASDKLSKVVPDNIAKAVTFAINKEKTSWSWSIREALDSVTLGKQTGLISTWVHEIGHQVHLKAGSPRQPNFPSLTEYGAKNGDEWHAEHFAAWVLNRNALLSWNKEVAEYFDKLIDSVL